MRACGDCNACCTGILRGNVRGKYFGELNPCYFLDKQCTIYEERPSQCRHYYCAWAQELLSEPLRPDNCNAIVSVEIDHKNKQYLKILYSKDCPKELLEEVEEFCKKNNTYFTINRVIPILTS